MNGDDYGPTLSDFSPSWMKDGGGVSGQDRTPNLDDYQDWASNVGSFVVTDQDAWSRDNRSAEDSGAGGFTVKVDATGDFAGGETMVVGVDTITFNSDLFKIHDNGGGEVQVTLITTTCS